MAAILKTEKSPYFSNGLTYRHHATLSILPNKTANIIKEKESVPLSCKSHRFKL